MARHSKNKKHHLVASDITNNNKSDNKAGGILERIGNKTRELANKLLPDKWRTPQIPTKIPRHNNNNRSRKQKIPLALRQACWVKQFGETYRHKCYVDWCPRNITCFDFEVGHNMPESKGGSIDLDNLRPICRQCNIGMGNAYTIDQWRLLKIKC